MAEMQFTNMTPQNNFLTDSLILKVNQSINQKFKYSADTATEYSIQNMCKHMNNTIVKYNDQVISRRVVGYAF